MQEEGITTAEQLAGCRLCNGRPQETCFIVVLRVGLLADGGRTPLNR